jgi:hypothetical protein
MLSLWTWNNFQKKSEFEFDRHVKREKGVIEVKRSWQDTRQDPGRREVLSFRVFRVVFDRKTV